MGNFGCGSGISIRLASLDQRLLFLVLLYDLAFLLVFFEAGQRTSFAAGEDFRGFSLGVPGPQIVFRAAFSAPGVRFFHF